MWGRDSDADIVQAVNADRNRLLISEAGIHGGAEAGSPQPPVLATSNATTVAAGRSGGGLPEIVFGARPPANLW